MPTPEELNQIREHMTLADLHSPVSDKMDEALEALQIAKAEFEKNKVNMPPADREFVEKISAQMKLTKNLDRLDAMTFEVKKEPVGVVEGEEMLDLEVDTEDLVTLIENRYADDTDVEIDPDYGKAEEAERQKRLFGKIKHSVVMADVNPDEMRATRESKMDDVRKQRAERLKKIEEKAAEDQQKIDEWVGGVARRLNNKVELLRHADGGAMLSISGLENLQSLGLSECKEGETFGLQIAKVSQSNGIPTLGFRLVKIKGE